MDIGALAEFFISLFKLLFEALDEEIFGIDISGMLSGSDVSGALGDLGGMLGM